MRHAIVVFIMLCGVVLCNAQSYKISGIVKNSAGTGIEGVTVRLGTADISTKTGSDGNFTLTGSAAVLFPSGKTVSNMRCPIVLRNGKLSFVTAYQGKARLMVYDCNGRLQLSRYEDVSPGNNVLSLPRFSNGLHIYNMSLEGTRYTFKTIAGITATSSVVTTMNTISPAKQAKTASSINDMLLVSKSGYQLYSLEIKNSDTSGIKITLSPWETGTLTDINGIVYHTIKIGNQVWTMENIRTTKYNDGTPIANLNDAAWDTTTKGAYCFYNNSSDPAIQQKWGAYYNWFAANSGKLAPAGWRVSNNSDWDSLLNYLTAHNYTYDGTSASSMIKSIAASTDWGADTIPMSVGNNLSINNTSGFSGLPGGCCYAGGKFNSQDTTAFWWTTTEFNDQMAVYRCIAKNFNNVWNMAFPTMKILGLSVRLVKE